jgi:hypothetical protein
MKAGHTNLLREKQIFAGKLINMPIVDNFFTYSSRLMWWESEGYGSQKPDILSPEKVINNFYDGI